MTQPQMMVLANLLEHPEIKPERMSSTFAGRKIKRTNKDLGRVMAISYLEQSKGRNDFRPWGYQWKDVLAFTFPDNWKDLG